jgi:hypothetical protein
VVEQPVTRTNVRGEPIRPAYLRITIRRERASRVTTDTRQIGIVGGIVGGVVGRAGQPAGPSPDSRVETVWRGETLMFLDSRHGPDGPRSADWFERRESWSLEPDGRLRIEIVSETQIQPEQTVVFLYRRE